MYADKSGVEKSWSAILEGVVDMVYAHSTEGSAEKSVAFWVAEVGGRDWWRNLVAESGKRRA